MFDTDFGKCKPIFKKFFHQVIRKNILSVYTLRRFPPYQQNVATLPCEIRKSKNVTKFFTLNVTIMFN